MFGRILVAIRLSSSTWAAIPYVRHLASNFGSELHLLGLSAEPQPVWDRSLMDYVESLAGNLHEEKIKVKTGFIHGNPAVEIVKYCGKNQIDLIATTSGTSSDINCSILNSIARKMGLDVIAPVLMVPGKSSREADAAEKIDLLRMLVPLDCSEVSEAVFPYVEAIAKKNHSSVTLLHVNTPPVRPAPVLNSEVINISRSVGDNYIRNKCGYMRSQGIEADCEVIDGPAVKTIVKYANTHRVNLIVMGTRATGGIEGWLYGSITNKVLERTEIPVLAVSLLEAEEKAEIYG